MRKIPFNNKYRPEIESGEMKVVNGKGKPVTILKWDMQGNYPILGVVMTNQTNYEGDESWEEERPFAYNNDGHAYASSPSDKKDLYLLIEGPDMSALEKELMTMLDFAKHHAKPDADIVGIFLDRVYECTKWELMGKLPKWEAIDQEKYVLEPHLGKKKDGTISLFSDHTLSPNEIECVISVADLDKLPKVYPSRINP